MANDLKVTLLSQPLGVEFESCMYDGRTVFCAPPGESFSIRVTANDPQKFRDMTNSFDAKVQVHVTIDGNSVGYSNNLCPDHGVNFKYMRNKMGCFQLKFKEPKVVGSDDDFETMKVNASKQWDSKVGTIIVEWRLYKKGAFLYSSKTTNEPPRHESVGNTKKFWERPSASVELGQEFPSPNGGIFHHYVKTYIAGAHYTGKSTVWYHHPSVVDVLRIKSENGGAYVSPAPNTPHRRSAKRKAPVFLVDLTDIDETTGSGSSSTGCNSGNSSGSSSGSSSKGKVIDLMNDDDDGKCEVLDLTVAAKRAHQKSEFMRFLGNEFI